MALTPKYLQECTDDIEKIYWELGTDILVDIAERIMAVKGMTATAEYLNEKLREMGLQQAWINQMLAKVMNTSEQEVEKLMNESTHKSTRSTFDILQKAGYDTTGLEFSDQILKTTNALNGDLQNLTRTTGQLATKAMMNAYDQAYLQASSGAYSLDQAVTNAIQKLAKDGLGQVEYPSGAHRTVEAAVRVAVRTAVSQNALACEKQVIDELDVNLVETSSHIGARPSHEVWQGKVFWVKYPEGSYENFYEATGYGTPTGLGGYNCRHQFYPYFPEFGQTYKPIPHEINDAAYKAEQKQRAYERKIREWDRKERVLKAGGQDTTEARRWKNYYKGQIQKLVDQSKGFLKRDYSAERSYGNGKGISAQAKSRSSAEQSYGNSKNTQAQVRIRTSGELGVTKKKSTPIRKDKNYPSHIPVSEVDLSKLNKTVNEQKQNKHIKGTNEYDEYLKNLRKAGSKYPEQSYIIIVLDEVQSLVNLYSGTGVLTEGLSGTWSDEEVVLDNEVVIGYAVLEDGTHEATSYFKIHYSSAGTHIVPMSKERGIEWLKNRRYNK